MSEDLDLEALAEKSALELIEWVFETYGTQAAIGTSFQKNGAVIIHMAGRVCDNFRVYFIDTLLNHDETYQFIEEIEENYGIKVEKYKPDPDDLEKLYRNHGKYPHLFSKKEREKCCHIRKVKPARRVEATLEAVIKGLRAEQSDFRAEKFGKIYYDENRNPPLLTVNPLYEYTDRELDEYIEEHDVPIHPLYDYVSEYGERYESIGCKCCHFPVQPWRDKRSGKFPWENGDKECGLHV